MTSREISMNGICNLSRSIVWNGAALVSASLVVMLIRFAGCSTSKPPTDTLAKAELGVRAAREAGANELASMDLKRATEKLERANQAMTAAASAEAKAETAIVRRAADDLQRIVDAVQTDAERESRKPLTAKPEKE